MSSRKNIAISVLALSLLGLGGFAWQQELRLRELSASLEAATKASKELRARLAAAEGRSKASERASRRAQAASVEPGDEAPPPDAPPPDEGPGQRFQGRKAAFRDLEKNPEFQQLMALQARGMLENRYADLFKKLNLPPAALEAFKGLLADKQNAIRDTLEVAREKGLTGQENRDQVRALVKSTQAELDESIRTTIGDAAFSQYKTYEQTVPQRAVSSQLEQRLSYTQTPLSEDQSSQLIQALTTSKIVRQGPGLSGTSQVTDQTIAQAQGFLSAPQLQALQQIQAEQAAQAKAAKLLRDQRSTPPPPPANSAPKP